MTKQKTYEFNIGDKVVKATSRFYQDEYSGSTTVPLMYDPDRENYQVGEVTDISAKGRITVKWTKPYGHTETLDAKDLFPEEVGQAKWTELEKEFKEVQKQVKEKVKEA